MTFLSKEKNSFLDANTKAENTKEESSTQENRFKQWMERESGKVDMNLNWKEKLRDQVKEQLKVRKHIYGIVTF